MDSRHVPDQPALGVGIVGAGGFGHFIAEALSTLPELRLVAVCDQDPDRAASLARPRGGAVHGTAEGLLADDRVQVVVVATPPATHAPLAMAALAAGRHVFCEKPSGTSPEQVAGLAGRVRSSGLAYVVDHVIHYNPLVQLLHRLQGAGVLGGVQRYLFENDAGDSDLGPEHWFWEPEHSGGIFLEHGVHFFDVARLLSGSAEEQVQAMAHRRPDGRTDTVIATVRHHDGSLATHAHGFSHANAAERQLMRVDFGLAEARLDGWIPLSLTLDAWLDEPARARLEQVVTDPGWLAVPGFRPGAHQDVSLVELPGAPQPLHTHDEDHHRPHHVRLDARLGTVEDKQEVYRESVRAALFDLAHCAATGGRPQAGIDEGAAAVEVAHAATLALDGTARQVVSRR